MSIVFHRSVTRPLVAAALAVQVMIFQVATMVAQQTPAPGNVDVNVDVRNPASTTTTPVWYGNWWVWAIGVAIFLIIIIALTNRGRDKTIIKE